MDIGASWGGTLLSCTSVMHGLCSGLARTLVSRQGSEKSVKSIKNDSYIKVLFYFQQYKTGRSTIARFLTGKSNLLDFITIPLSIQFLKYLTEAFLHGKRYFQLLGFHGQCFWPDTTQVHLPNFVLR